jgi:hypothetical protein
MSPENNVSKPEAPSALIWLNDRIIHPNQITYIYIFDENGKTAWVHFVGGKDTLQLSGEDFASFMKQLKAICPPPPVLKTLSYISE